MRDTELPVEIQLRRQVQLTSVVTIHSVESGWRHVHRRRKQACDEGRRRCFCLSSMLKQSSSVSPYPPETALLRASVRLCLGLHGARDECLALIHHVNWTRLLWIGGQCGGLSFLEAALRQVGPGSCPPSMQAQLAEFRITCQLRSMERSREWCLVQDEFSRRGITAIVASGSVLALRFCRQLTLREPELLLSVFVRPADRAAAEETLRALGYDLTPDAFDLAGQTRSRVRIRTRLGSGTSAEAVVWEGVEHFAFAGRNLPVLSPINWLLHRCRVSSRELWSDWRDIFDVGLLLQRHSAMDWDEALTQGSRLQMLSSVLVGLAVAHRMLSWTLPISIERELVHRPTVNRTVATLERSLRTGAAIGYYAKVQTRIALQPDLRKKVRWAYRHLRRAFQPTASVRVNSESALTTYGLYCPSRPPVVDAMLRLAETGPTDIVCDLGCGDGRLVIEAAAKFGSRGLGIDSDPQRIAEARAAATARGVNDRATFVQGDLMRTSVGEATVVCVYLQGFVYEKIRRKLEREMPPGARIVSHDFIFPDWPPEKTELVRSTRLRMAQIYLWRLP